MRWLHVGTALLAFASASSRNCRAEALRTPCRGASPSPPAVPSCCRGDVWDGHIKSSQCSLVALLLACCIVPSGFHQGPKLPGKLREVISRIGLGVQYGPTERHVRPGEECSSYFANRFSSSSSARGGASHCVIKCAFRLASSARRGASVHLVYAFRLFCPRPQVVA